MLVGTRSAFVLRDEGKGTQLMAGTIALAPSRLGPRGLRLPRQSDLRALLVALLTAALIASVLTVAENPFAIDAATPSQEGSVSSAVDVADDLTTGSSQSVLPGEVLTV